MLNKIEVEDKRQQSLLNPTHLAKVFFRSGTSLCRRFGYNILLPLSFPFRKLGPVRVSMEDDTRRHKDVEGRSTRAMLWNVQEAVAEFSTSM